MKQDNRLAILIFVALVAMLLTPLAYQGIKEYFRPRLVEARIVTASDRDPVFRDGPRHAPPGAQVEIAVALRLERSGGRTSWLAPATGLVLGGEQVEHVNSKEWPDSSRAIRVFWFTVECVNVGGDMTPDNAAQRMKYRTYLAPEMGRGLLADTYPEAHNDDHLGLPPGTTPHHAGTLRFYARIEVFDPERDLSPDQIATTAPVDRLFDSDFPAVFRATAMPEGIDPSVGELFLLPGFEPAGEGAASWNAVPRASMGLDFTELVHRRFAVSSRTFAATALAGKPDFDPTMLTSFGPVSWTDGLLRHRGRPLRWRDDVNPGDVLHAESHWVVLLADDGNGLADAGDGVIHCWRRPASQGTLGSVLQNDVGDLELVQNGR